VQEGLPYCTYATPTKGNKMTEYSAHYGHKIVISEYLDLDGSPVNYAIECEDCFTVLADEEITK
jgi:hypothetical protein